MTLSDKIRGWNEDLLEVEDVKEFIKDLNKWALHTLCHYDLNQFMDKINQLAGDKLI